MEWPLAAYIGFDRGRGKSRTVAWLGKYVDGVMIYTPITAEQFFADPVKEKESDLIVIDEYETYSRRTELIVDMRPETKQPKPKSKPWVAMNKKPAWLGRRK